MEFRMILKALSAGLIVGFLSYALTLTMLQVAVTSWMWQDVQFILGMVTEVVLVYLLLASILVGFTYTDKLLLTKRPTRFSLEEATFELMVCGVAIGWLGLYAVHLWQ